MSQPKKPTPPKDTNVVGKPDTYKKPAKPLQPSKLVTNK